MKWAILFLTIVSMQTHAKEVTFVWEHSSALNSGITFELRTSLNDQPWDTIATPDRTFTKTLDLVEGSRLKVEVRAMPSAQSTCYNAPCQPSSWATFKDLPLGTNVVYPKTPIISNVTLTGFNDKL